MMNEFLSKIKNNQFINDLRMHLSFNDKAYDELLEVLNDLKVYLKDKMLMDKRLAGELYLICHMTLIWRDKLIAYGKDENDEIILKVRAG